jgi:hypothetical protein
MLERILSNGLVWSCSHVIIALENLIPNIHAKVDPGNCASHISSSSRIQLHEHLKVDLATKPAYIV